MAGPYTLFVDGVDYSSTTLSDIRFTYGRQDLGQQCQPSTATFRMVYNSSLGTWAPNTVLPVGALIEIKATWPTFAAVTVFRGRVTDLRMSPMRPVCDVIAVNDALSSLGRVQITLAAQTGSVGTVATTILNAAKTAGALKGITVNSATTGDQIVTPAISEQTATQLLGQVLASDLAGVLVEMNPTTVQALTLTDRNLDYMPPTNKFTYSGGTNRFSRLSTLSRVVGDKVNTAYVSSLEAQGVSQSASDVATFGVFSTQQTTLLQTTASAQSLADIIVTRQTTPGWRTDRLRMIMTASTDTFRNYVAKNMRCGSYLTTPSLATGAPTNWFVEGWVDVISQGAETYSWFRDLYVTDAALSVGPELWSTVTSTLAWSAVGGTVKWSDLINGSI